MGTVCRVLPGAYRTRLPRVTLPGPASARPFPPAKSFLPSRTYFPRLTLPVPLTALTPSTSSSPILPFPHSSQHFGLASPVGRPPPLFSSALPSLLHPIFHPGFSFSFCPPLPSLASSPLPLFLPFPHPDLQPRSRVPESRRCHTRGCRQRAAVTAPKVRVTVPGGRKSASPQRPPTRPPALCSPLGLLTKICSHSPGDCPLI